MENKWDSSWKSVHLFGVQFLASLSCHAQFSYLASVAQPISTVIVRCYHSIGKLGAGISIKIMDAPAVCMVFQAKIASQLLYCFQIGSFAKLNIIETVQNKFIRDIPMVPKCIKNAILCVETGIISLDTAQWFLLHTFCLKLILLPINLAPLVFRGCFKSVMALKSPC